MVELTGLEPVTPTMSTWYSNHLSYSSKCNDIILADNSASVK